jgi:uncharacterized zinc-type alcohol dehydrogenase-like protein
MGHEVTVFSHSPSKRVYAKEIGVTNFRLITNSKWSRGLTKYFDLIINASPAPFDLTEYIVFLKSVGKFCYLGLPFEKQSFFVTKLADYGSRIVYGSYVGSIAEIHELLKFVEKYKVYPDIIEMPVADYVKAIKMIKKGIPYKRIVLKW